LVGFLSKFYWNNDMKTLSAVIDNVNDIFFYNKPVDDKMISYIISFLAERLAAPGGYAKTFAPLADELKNTRLFTGEKPSPLSASHILAEESCRALLLLGKNSIIARETLATASKSLEALIYRVELNSSKRKIPEFFCCPKCTCGLWRNLAVGNLPTAQYKLKNGVDTLKKVRDSKGGWKLFPFHYTLFTLLEINLPQAKQELQYAAKRCNNELKKKRGSSSIYSQRQMDVMKRVLEHC
jgi:hypothetical protein